MHCNVPRSVLNVGLHIKCGGRSKIYECSLHYTGVSKRSILNLKKNSSYAIIKKLNYINSMRKCFSRSINLFKNILWYVVFSPGFFPVLVFRLSLLNFAWSSIYNHCTIHVYSIPASRHPAIAVLALRMV